MLKVATAPPNEPYREYKDVERVYSGSTEIDKILDKNGNVLFAVNKEVEGTPALTYKGKEETNLKNYRIYGNTETLKRSYSGSAPLSFPIVDGAVSNYRVYGQTSRNLFDFGEWSKNINANNDNSLVKSIDGITITANSNDAFTAPYAYAHEGVYKIYVKPNTNYLLSWVSNNNLYGRVFVFKNGAVDGSHIINVNNAEKKYLLFDTDTNTEFVTLRFGVSNAGDSITYSKIMLIEGSTALPYEPYGESVGNKTANILPLSRTPITETHGDFLCEYDGLGTITLTTDKDNATTDGEFVIPLIQDFTIPVSIGQGGTGCLQINNDCYGNSLGNISFVYNSTAIDTWSLNALNRIHSSYSVLGNKIVNQIAIYIAHSISYRKITIRPAFVENVTEQAPFEPYGFKIPITNNSETANIYLDEPLTKQGDNADYIDYAEQKRYNADGTNEDVTLPALPAQSSTNSLSIGTTVQPSSLAVDVAEVVSCGDKVTDSQSVNYGKYKIPVTLTAGSAETTDIYLDAPLAKSGDNADYIDYATQKRHNSDGTESTVTLPEIAVTAGTNTLTVGTEVQPSNVYLKGRIKEIT